MTFSQSKQLTSSNKFLLAQIGGGNLKDHDDVEVIGVDTYRQTLPIEAYITSVAKYNVNNRSEALNFVPYGSTLSDGEFTFNIKNGLTTVEYSIVNSPVAFQQEYHQIEFDILVGTSAKVLNRNPVTGSGPLVAWEPRLFANSKFSNTIRNMITGGVFTISGSSVDLDNTDLKYKGLIDPSISFSGRAVSVWAGINSDIKLVFNGNTKAIKYDSKKLAFVLRDGFSNLRSPAYFGDTYAEAIHSLEDNSSLFPGSDGTVSRMFLGGSGYQSTPYNYGDGDSGSEVTVAGLTLGLSCLGGTAPAAVCDNFSPVLSGTVNRQWNLGRVVALGSGGSTVAGPASIDVLGVINNGVDKRYTIVLRDPVNTAGFQFLGRPGREITVSQGANTVSGFLVYNSNGVMAIEQSFSSVGNDWSPFSSGVMTVTANNRSVEAVLVKGSTQVPLLHGVHYTISTSTTTNGNNNVILTLSDNVEDDIDKGDFLAPDGVSTVYTDPADTSIFFRIMPTLNNIVTVGEGIRKLVQSSGMVVNSDSFSQYNTILNATDGTHPLELSFNTSVPEGLNASYPTYLDVLQRWLSSVGSILRFNANAEVEIALLEDYGQSSLTGDIAPDSIDINDSLILQRSMKSSVEYDDMVSKLIFNNEGDVKYSYSQRNREVTDFHNIVNEVNLPIFTTSYDGTTLGGEIVKDIVFKLRTNPNYVTSYSVSSENIDSKLVDEVDIISSILQIKGIVTTVTKTIDKTTVEITSSTT